MPSSRRLTRVATAVLGVALLTACSAAQGQPDSSGSRTRAAAGHRPPAVPPAATVALATDRQRQSEGVVASGGTAAPYNYGPTVLLDGGRYRVWWCSQLPGVGVPGDDVLYAESTSLDGPFAAPDGSAGSPVFHGAGNGFDAMHTCDPSVLAVNGTYYLYYTGAAGDHAHGNAVGVATSSDGITWTRAAGGRPIVSPSGEEHRDNTYGAGQPSVLYLDGWFYLMFTDTTGRAAGSNGAGQFVLRSMDPTFQSGVQALGANGFSAGRGAAAVRQRSVVDAFSADWMWVDALNAFAIAHETAEGTRITFWDREFSRTPYRPVVVPGSWREGPGLVRRSDGHAPVTVEDPCGRVPVDVLRATADGAGPTDLAHFGVDLHGMDGCGDPRRAAAVLDGYAAPSPERTVDVVVGGQLVRVERRSVAEQLSAAILDRRLPALDRLPLAVRVPPGVKAVSAPGRPLGLLLADGRLWPVSSARIAQLNSSVVEQVPVARWDGYPRGVDLSHPRR